MAAMISQGTQSFDFSFYLWVCRKSIPIMPEFDHWNINLAIKEDAEEMLAIMKD